MIIASEILQRWLSLTPIASGNADQKPLPELGPGIIPVIVLNQPGSLNPAPFSGSAGGAGNKLAYTVLAGWQFVCTGIFIYNSANSAIVIYDGSTAVYDMGVFSTITYGVNSRDFIPGGFTFRSSIVLNSSANVTTTWTFFGYLERISE